MSLHIPYTLLFLFSFLGLQTAVTRLFKIRRAFAPIVTVSLISLMIYVGGLCNALFLVAGTLYLGGIAYGAYALFHKYFKISFHVLFAVACVIALIAFLENAKLMHYDNFSHWATIVQDMLKFDAFPAQTNNNITIFITYPPGTACFLYYVCRFIGTSENVMIIAQAFITLFSILPVFALIKKKHMIHYIVFICMSVIVFTINIHIYDLLVDTLLATIGFSITVILYEYRKNCMRALPSIICLMSFLCLIKNSGLFFVIGNIVLYVYFYLTSHKVHIKGILYTIVMFLIPFLLLSLWKQHTTLVFSAEQLADAKHTLSMAHYLKNLNLLDYNAISDISRKFVMEIVSIENAYVVTFYVLDTIGAMACIWHNWRFGKAILALNLYFIIYILSLWAMYIFSMPYEEAIDLASFDRYFATFLLYFILILFMNFYIQEIHWKRSVSIAVVTGITLGSVCDLRSLQFPRYENIDYLESGRSDVEKQIEPYRNMQFQGQLVIVKVPPTLYSNGYYQHYVRYMLHYDNILIIRDDIELEAYSDYLLIA